MWPFLLLAILCNSAANVAMKVATGSLGPSLDIRSLVGSAWLWLGVTLFGVALIFYLAVLQRMQLSVAYPIMTGTGFMLVTIASVFLFNETITWTKVFGSGVILIGAILLTRS